MSWFSKTEDYDISSSNLGEESPEFNTLYGTSHEIHPDGTSHTTYWDADSNTRRSYDTDADGNISNDHSTDQDTNKHRQN